MREKGPTSEMVLAELNDLNPGIERFETYREAKSCWEHAGIAIVKGECPDPTGTTRKYTAFRVHYADLLGPGPFSGCRLICAANPRRCAASAAHAPRAVPGVRIRSSPGLRTLPGMWNALLRDRNAAQ